MLPQVKDHCSGKHLPPGRSSAASARATARHCVPPPAMHLWSGAVFYHRGAHCTRHIASMDNYVTTFYNRLSSLT